VIADPIDQEHLLSTLASIGHRVEVGSGGPVLAEKSIRPKRLTAKNRESSITQRVS